MTEYEQKRRNDELNTKFIEAICDEKIYKEISIDIKRITNKDLQIRGIDLIWNDMKIDEKVAINFINRNLTTFAFELSTLNNSNSVGWFMNGSIFETTHYLIGYLKGNLNKKQLDEIELVLIEKDKIWSYLNKYKFDTNIIKLIREKKIQPNKTTDKGANVYLTNVPGVKVTHSEQFRESPINVVINKNILVRLSEQVFLLKDGKLTVTKVNNKK